MPETNPPQPDAEKIPPSAGIFDSVRQPAEHFRNIPHASESFGNVPKHAEDFRTVPKASEPFRIVPQTAVRRENCTLTVREVARMFETAGVARSERSITNWCQPNRQGIARLEAYFDPNERRYFITPQSVEAVIAEEKAKAAKTNAEPMHNGAEGFRTSRPGYEASPTASKDPEPARKTDPASADELAELKKENRDLQIANRGKDYFIERLEKERETMLTQLVESSRSVGKLETRLHQLEAPKSPRRLDVRSESDLEPPEREQNVSR